VFQAEVVDKKHTFSVTFFSENLTVFHTMWKKYGTAGQFTDDNTVLRMRFAW
jgi:hypothetical protein